MSTKTGAAGSLTFGGGLSGDHAAAGAAEVAPEPHPLHRRHLALRHSRRLPRRHLCPARARRVGHSAPTLMYLLSLYYSNTVYVCNFVCFKPIYFGTKDRFG